MDAGSQAPGRRVVVADAQPLFRLGAVEAVQRSVRLQPMASVGDSESLLRVIAESGAHVALVGTNLPPSPGAARVTGLGAAMAVRRHFPDVAVVVVSDRPREAELFDALRFGTAAYLGRAIEPSALASVLVRVADGAVIFDSAVLAPPALSQGPQPSKPKAGSASPDVGTTDGATGISAREVEVLTLIGRGRSNREIGEALQIGDQTVKNHVTTILRKLGVSDRTQAVVEAIRTGVMRA